MANTENIEAKLCAFVDGELDDADRAEIEQHLLANPQHRQLIQELTRQRELLRELPRAKSPDDLLEAVQNQMERSVLLDPDSAGRHLAGRISRRPQILAAAAVLLLAAGLVAVIVFVLPNQGRPPHDLAILTDPPTTPASLPAAVPAGPPVPEEIAAAPEPDVLARRETKDDIFAEPAAPAQPHAGKGSGPAHFADNSALPNIFANGLTEQEWAERLKQSPGVPDQSMLVVVSSDDPSSAQRQVQQYLDSNGIRWEAVPEPMPAPLEFQQGQVIAPSRLQQTRMQLKKTAEDEGQLDRSTEAERPAEQAPADQGIASRTNSTEDAGTRSAQDKKASKRDAGAEAVGESAVEQSSPAEASAAPVPEEQALADGRESKAGEVKAEASPAPPAPTESSVDASQPDSSRPDAAAATGVGAPTLKEKEFARSSELEAPQQEHDAANQQLATAAPTQSPQMQQQATSSLTPQYIVARGLTREQVNQLNTNIAPGGDRRGRVANYFRDGDSVTPASPQDGITRQRGSVDPATQSLPRANEAATPAQPYRGGAFGALTGADPISPAEQGIDFSAAADLSLKPTARANSPFGGSSETSTQEQEKGLRAPPPGDAGAGLSAEGTDTAPVTGEANLSAPSEAASVPLETQTQSPDLGSAPATSTAVGEASPGAPPEEERVDVVIIVQAEPSPTSDAPATSTQPPAATEPATVPAY